MFKKEALKYYGSSTQVAHALEISRQAVEKWPDIVPEGSAYKLQVLTNNQLRVNPALYQKSNQQAHAAA